MGKFNSSVSCVWPIFDRLFQSDPTGAKWLSKLLRLGSRVKEVDQNILSSAISVRDLRSSNAHCPANSGEQLKTPINTKCLRGAGPAAGRFPSLPSGESAKADLAEGRAGSRTRFGGLTNKIASACWLANRSLAGKDWKNSRGWSVWIAAQMVGVRRLHFGRLSSRNEISAFIDRGQAHRTHSQFHRWYPDRNQIIRNLEVAQALANGRNFAVLLCAERPEELPEKAWTKGLPHFSPAEIKELKRHYLGCATWATIAKEL